MPFWQTSNGNGNAASSSTTTTSSSSTSSSSMNSNNSNGNNGCQQSQKEDLDLILLTDSSFLMNRLSSSKRLHQRAVTCVLPGLYSLPGESLTATVFKFVEPPENNDRQLDQKSRVKFKIMSLKVKGEMEYVPEMFDEQKDQVAVEQILRALEKLKRQLAEAEAELEARKKPPEDAGPRVVNEGLVIDEWKERRERYLARQQVEVDSV
ncbi:hypothetical protein OIU78_026801 [Salix suchowensis]|nr:hypothetical protein OIU78_026801 [Salix suchowensis]